MRSGFVAMMEEMYPQYLPVLRKFKGMLRADGYAENTVETYAYAFWQFVLFCMERDKDLSEATEDDLLEFINSLKERYDMSKRTLLVKYSAVKYLLTKVFGKEVDINLKFRITPSERVRKMRVPSEKDVNEYFEYVAKKDPLLYKLFVFIYGIGLRISEALNLKWEDINLDEGYIRVFGKGGKVRFVPLPSSIKAHIKLWLKLSEVNSEYVFPSPRYPDRPLSRATVDKRLKAIQEELFGSKKYSAHSFRHGFATHFLKLHRDIYLLSKILGHSDIKITTIYTHIVPHKEKVLLPIDNLVLKKSR